MKKVEITSKYSADKIMAAQGKTIECKKDIPHREQQRLINEVYLNTIDNHGIESAIKKKISGYKAQDKKSGDPDRLLNLITYEETMEKLVCSKLKCYYCSAEMKVLYFKAREPLQWTLDRINNDLGHTETNTVIACMGCNLQRRRRSADAFTFTKKLQIKKESDS